MLFFRKQVKEILEIINSNKITLAYLNNLESGTVKSVINGEYVLSFVALIEPLKTEFLYNKDNLIEYENDYFRVINIEEEHNSDNMLKVYVNCEHISYDLIKQKKTTYTQTNRAAIYVMNDLLLNSGFTFIGTDVLTTASIDVQQETDIKSLLYQVANIWNGELTYFQNDIELKQQLGTNRGTDFRFGKNVANLKRYIDYVENIVAYEIEVVQGAELEELGQYFLGDTIRVVDEALQIELDIRIIEIEKDLVTSFASRVVLGQPIKDLSNSFNNVFQTLNIAKQIAEDTSNKVDNVIDEHGNLIASKLSGTLNTAITQVENSTGNVTFDDRGLITTNQPLETESTKAVLMTSDGILIANAKNADGTWRWRTAVTGDSISADAITTGTLSAININGVNITGSTITSDNANAEIKLNAGVLSVKDKTSTAQFNVNYREGLPQDVLQTELDKYFETQTINPNKVVENTISLNSANSHMGLEFGNGAVSLGNDWVNISMYGGTSDWQTLYPTQYANYLAGVYDEHPGEPPPTTAQGSKMVVKMATSYWKIQDYDGVIPNYVVGNSFLVFDVDYTEILGNFEVHGTKDCVVETDEYGKLHFGAYETPEYYFGDIGENEVVDGICTIELDEMLTRCVNTDIPYQVFLTPYGQGNIWVEQRNSTNFIVKGDNIPFGYEVKAKRKNYEKIRFGQTI